jgi:hypothetical protein
MGWEVRHGKHRYLYRNRRVNGRPVKQYVAAANDSLGVAGFGDLMADILGRVQRRSARFRKLRKRVRSEYRERIDDLVRATRVANTDLRIFAEGVLYAMGFHKHKRSEWRMRLELAHLKNKIGELERQRTQRVPLLNYSAPANDAEAVELFAKARSGDTDAQARVYRLLQERKWVDWIGNIGRQATANLIRKAAGGDPVWEAGLTQKVDKLWNDLLGEKPTVLDKLLVRRVVNGWIAVHALELELTTRPPAEARDRDHLDRALSRAQRRFTEAARELARVRKLALPAILLNIAEKHVNIARPSPR